MLHEAFKPYQTLLHQNLLLQKAITDALLLYRMQQDTSNQSATSQHIL